MTHFRHYILSAVLLTFAAGSLPSWAEEQVYGWELMSAQERKEHREKIRSLKTREERERYRLEHHQKMLERAKQRGVTLPEVPPRDGQQIRDRDSMGPGSGTGPGMGSGKGSNR